MKKFFESVLFFTFATGIVWLIMTVAAPVLPPPPQPNEEALFDKAWSEARNTAVQAKRQNMLKTVVDGYAEAYNHVKATTPLPEHERPQAFISLLEEGKLEEVYKAVTTLIYRTHLWKNEKGDLGDKVELATNTFSLRYAAAGDTRPEFAQVQAILQKQLEKK
ncbi:MAG: hypothetical protein RJB39_198 [Candidatus Parcubacteria bacterium]|jgi:hypothetical protein